jgi:hypothetical protein
LGHKLVKSVSRIVEHCVEVCADGAHADATIGEPESGNLVFAWIDVAAADVDDAETSAIELSEEQGGLTGADHRHRRGLLRGTQHWVAETTQHDRRGVLMDQNLMQDTRSGHGQSYVGLVVVAEPDLDRRDRHRQLTWDQRFDGMLDTEAFRRGGVHVVDEYVDQAQHQRTYAVGSVSGPAGYPRSARRRGDGTTSARST